MKLDPDKVNDSENLAKGKGRFMIKKIFGIREVSLLLVIMGFAIMLSFLSPYFFFSLKFEYNGNRFGE